MSYIKLFINVAKKQAITTKQNPDKELEKRINEIFKEPIDKLFDEPEIIRKNFDSFYNYSLGYRNELIEKGITLKENQIHEAVNQLIKTDKNNQI